MNKKILAFLIIASQAECMLEARGGGGGHGGGGHGGGGGHSRGGGGSHGGGHRSGGGHNGGHGGHGGGYGHGGYGRGGWGHGFGWAGGLWLGMALTMPLWWGNPSNSTQRELKNQVEQLQQKTYNMQTELDSLRATMNQNEINRVQNKIETNKEQVKELLAQA